VMGWTNPAIIALLAGGVALLGLFVAIETRVAQPMFELGLFRIRAFAAGNVASLCGSIARGGLQFMLVIWLQGIWLPLHGYDYSETPVWAGIAMLPLSVGFLIAGPLSGMLSDRFGARLFATTGMLVSGAAFVGLMLLPIDFPYWTFALFIFGNGIGVGMFGAPNASAIMSSVPASRRGVASGMRSTFQNAGATLSIGVFFSLMIAGLAHTLPATLSSGLQRQGISPGLARQIGALPPVSSLFAAFLGANPIEQLLEPSGALAELPKANRDVLVGREFFPHLISPPFHRGLTIVFAFATALEIFAAIASLLRGGRYVHEAPGRRP